MVPAYIRYFATTDGSAIGALALELAKSMQKIAPVRVVSMSGVLVDEWMKHAHMTATPMVGSYVNVVACDPSRWVMDLKIPMPERDTWQSATSGVKAGAGKVEFARERRSLYTAGVRNVLYAVAAPRSRSELDAALAFECVIAPNETHRRWWAENSKRDVEVIGYPMADALVRKAICGD